MATAIAEPPHLTADLKALYLSTVASQWRPLAEQAARQRQAPADYLAQLVHLEVTGRRERRIQRRIQDARFPMLKTLDAFSWSRARLPRYAHARRRTCTSLGLLLLEIRSARRGAHGLVMRRRAAHFPPVPPRCRARAGRATRNGSVRAGRWPAAGACA